MVLVASLPLSYVLASTSFSVARFKVWSIMCNADPLFWAKRKGMVYNPLLATAQQGMGLGLSIDDTLTKPRRDKKTSESIAGIQRTPFFVRQPK